MTAAQTSHQAATPYGNMNWKSRETTRRTIIKQQYVFRYQLEKLHRLNKKQKELVEAFKAKVKGQSDEQLESSVTKPAINLEDEKVKLNELMKVNTLGSMDTDAPVTPKPMNPLTAGGKLVDQATSSPLHWFADIVTSFEHDADLALLQKRARLDEQKKARAAALESRRQKKRKMQMSRHPANCPIPKKSLTAGHSLHGWGTIKKGQRSRRVPDEDPVFTFQRGAFLFKWR